MRTLLLLSAALAATPALAQSDNAVPGQKRPEFTMSGAVNSPTHLPADIGKLRVPSGYAVSVAATDLGNARIVTTAQDGTVYITRRTEADVLMLKDADGDGTYETKRIVAARPNLHGIAVDGRTVYVVATRDLYSAPILADGSFGGLTKLVEDLPDAGQHANRTIAVGRDGMLYVSIGSTCNECNESNQENATILQVSPDGKHRKIYASGLRNTIGFDWNPTNGQLWGLDQGTDWLGDEAQPEELNRINEGRRYGWPYIFDAGTKNPHNAPPNGLMPDDWDRMSERMVMGYTPHAAAMQLKFARAAAFPADAQKDAFATFRGSWNRSQPSGYEVVRIRFDAAGNPTAMEPFLTGFLTTGPGGEAAWTGRPTGLAFAPDGSMLVTDSENGVLYRVRYTGNAAARPLPPLPRIAPVMPPPGPIALTRAETQATGRLTVTSPAFASGAALPERFSRSGDNASPPLAWSGAPSNTQGYAVIVDDPDTSPVKPTNHWLLWNIPAATTALPESLPGTIQLAEPKMARQGANTTGQIGWSGMKPPVGDPAHRYHVQVFALDGPLALMPGADREALIAAMKGHVLAKGEIDGTFAQPRPPARK
jgi:Raf kinase inhibitor-like YbhB/YbcL family protein